MFWWKYHEIDANLVANKHEIKLLTIKIVQTLSYTIVINANTFICNNKLKYAYTILSREQAWRHNYILEAK